MGTLLRRWFVDFCNSVDHLTSLFIVRLLLVDAIIFLAPISGFDQVLAEDKTVNRLVRSLAYT